MGQAKRMMMEHEENLSASADYLVTLKVLKSCEDHGYIFDSGTELSEVWPIAVAEWKKGASGRVPWAAGMKVREFTDLLSEAYEDNSGDGCHGCDKNDRD